MCLRIGVCAACLLLALSAGCSPQGESGSPLPSLEAQGWINGSPPDPAGKIMVIDAWASWCGPCRNMAPEMAQAYARYKDQGVVFVGLTPESAQQKANVQAFLDEFGITWPNGYDAGKTLEKLNIQGLPTVIVAVDGRITAFNEGGGRLDEALTQALATLAEKR